MTMCRRLWTNDLFCAAIVVVLAGPVAAQSQTQETMTIAAAPAAAAPAVQPVDKLSYRLQALATSTQLKAASAAARADMPVSGLISINTTCTITNSPYIVESSVTIASGAVLTIQSGTLAVFLGLNVPGARAGILPAAGLAGLAYPLFGSAMLGGEFPTRKRGTLQCEPS
jgi:hypothetical protein